MQHVYQQALNLIERSGIAWNTSTTTAIDGVYIYTSNQPHHHKPVQYLQGLFFVISGEKTSDINNELITYGQGKYLIVSSDYPLDCSTNASPRNPLIGIYISLDHELLHSIIEQLEMDLLLPTSLPTSERNFELLDISEEISDTLQRLLQTLEDPNDSLILGRGLKRELYYRVLLGDKGHILINLIRQNTTSTRIHKVADYLKHHYNLKITIEEMAELAGMSPSHFHRMFKQTYSDSPLQFLKKIRLNKAKVLLVSKGIQAQLVAETVGYESTAQFSREFKRYFDVPPSRAHEIDDGTASTLYYEIEYRNHHKKY